MKVQKLPSYQISLIQTYWIDFFTQQKELSLRHCHTILTRSYGWERHPAAMMEGRLHYLPPISLDLCKFTTINNIYHQKSVKVESK